jgi:hypothetical protein
MQRSGLFTRWSVRTATAVIWFYEGTGGGLTYWPQGPAGAARTVPAVSNTAIVGDNDRMPHRVEAVGDLGRWRTVPRGADLHHAGDDAWELRDGDTAVATYHLADLRISLSWKAEVFLDAADRERRAAHLDDLTAAQARVIMAAALREQGHWAADAPADANDPRWTEAVMTAYPRQSPPQIQLREPVTSRAAATSQARAGAIAGSRPAAVDGDVARGEKPSLARLHQFVRVLADHGDRAVSVVVGGDDLEEAVGLGGVAVDPDADVGQEVPQPRHPGCLKFPRVLGEPLLVLGAGGSCRTRR